MEKIYKLILPWGLKKAVYALAAALLLALLDLELLSFLAFLLTLFFLFAYRNPSRLCADISSYGVVSPVDGEVVAIENIEDAMYGYRVVIESSMLQSGLLCAPFEAKKVSFKLQRGSRLPKKSHLFSSLNESLEATFENEEKTLKILHRLKSSPLSIECKDKKEQMRSCELYGFAYDAVSVLYLPREFRLNVHIGQRLLASQNIIGYFSN